MVGPCFLFRTQNAARSTQEEKQCEGRRAEEEKHVSGCVRGKFDIGVSLQQSQGRRSIGVSGK